MQKTSSRISQTLFLLSLILIIYMPLHVFISQSASLVTGGIDVWKAAKDVLIFVASPLLLFLSYKRGLFRDKTFRKIAILGALYALLHGIFLVFDQNDDTYSALVGSVYNTRLSIYLLIGYLVGTAKNARKYLKYLLTATVLIATTVALFGIAQYFLPADLLEHVGYSLERGVKPLFFIDDKPNLPRVMSTLKDPNSLGAYLILPILLTGYALVNKLANRHLFTRPFRREALLAMCGIMLVALLLTFSRGALVGLLLSIGILLLVVKGDNALSSVKKFWYVPLIFLSIITISTIATRDTSLVQDFVFHAATTTDQADPNELRVSLARNSLQDVLETPGGHGPGTAGLVSINNPQGGALTENYYLQIAYEVGWLGLALFLVILSTIIYQLSNIARESSVAAVLLASLAAYLFYSLLIHLWSNEAVALQWWLLTGTVLGLGSTLKRTDYS